MRTLTALFAILALVITFTGVCATAAAQEKPVATDTAAPSATISVAGEWEGEVWRGGSRGRLLFHLKQEAERVWGTVDFPDRPQGAAYGVKVEGTLKDDGLELKMPVAAFGGFSLKLSKNGKTMEGSGLGATNVPFQVYLKKK
ncbi:MAG: hypothetical protein WAP51_04490 [Candidatus Sungiibacteriota bacterium]